MKALRALLVVMFWVILPAGSLSAEKPLSVQLREGKYKEQLEGDLDGAIEIYRIVIQRADEGRRYAAEAHYRMGMCYLKKDDKAGAVEQFSIVTNEYSAQTTTTDLARQELKKLTRIDPKTKWPIPVPITNKPIVTRTMPAHQRSQSPEPVVVSTSPAAFSNDVSPDLDKITVTFDRPMMDKSWSWTGGGDTFPDGAGDISYDSRRLTCTRPVKMKPGKVYWIGINSPSNRNFKTSSRVPAKWYIILFATKGADGSPTPIPKDMLERAKAINAVTAQYRRPQTTPTPRATEKLSVDDIIARSYVIHYKAVDQSKSALGLLNSNYPNGVKTHHANRYSKAGETIASICTDDQIGRDKIVAAINDSDELELVKVESPKIPTAPGAIKELSVDDGRSGGRESIGGSGHAVRFELPMPTVALTGIRIYGSRYGSPQAPKEDFHVWLCDKHFTVLEEFTFPYSRFTRGDPRWVTLKTDPTELPREFMICAGFDPHQTKGVYVHHDAHTSGNSYIGLPDSELSLFERGDWMIRPILSSAPAKKVDVNMTVETAVKIISTCAESDPRVGAAMATVKDLDESAVLSELKKYLTSEQAAIRRSAIYVLWQGEFSNIADAIPELEKLCSHDEDFTRGMAGLALGQNKVLSSFTVLEKMTLDDPSGYARRCGAYALGLLGDTKAKPTLEKALNDPDRLVQNNAEAALKMLELKSSKAGSVTDPIANNKKEAENLSAQGWKLWGQRKLTEAEEIFKQAIEKDPANEIAYQGLGWAQLNQGKKLNAKDSFEKCIKLNPKNSAALNGLGWIAHGQGDIEDAIQWWEKAVTAQPYATASLSGLTQVYVDRKEYDKAVKYYEMWLRAEPTNEQAKEGLQKAKSKSSIDLSTPEATIKSFVKAAYDGNFAAATKCVSKDGADYNEFKEMLATESNHPFQAMIKAMDVSVPIEITSKDVEDTRCKISWYFTLGRVYYFDNTKMKKGTHQKFGSYLELVGDKWLIRDI